MRLFLDTNLVEVLETLACGRLCFLDRPRAGDGIASVVIEPIESVRLSIGWVEKIHHQKRKRGRSTSKR